MPQSCWFRGLKVHISKVDSKRVDRMKVDRQRVNGVKVNSYICPSAKICFVIFVIIRESEWSRYRLTYDTLILKCDCISRYVCLASDLTPINVLTFVRNSDEHVAGDRESYICMPKSVKHKPIWAYGSPSPHSKNYIQVLRKSYLRVESYIQVWRKLYLCPTQ